MVAHIVAKPGHEATVRSVLEGFLAPTRGEKGCTKYELFQDASDSTKFFFIEEWESAADLEVHSHSAHLTAGKALLADSLAAAPVVHSLNKIA